MEKTCYFIRQHGNSASAHGASSRHQIFQEITELIQPFVLDNSESVQYKCSHRENYQPLMSCSGEFIYKIYIKKYQRNELLSHLWYANLRSAVAEGVNAAEIPLCFSCQIVRRYLDFMAVRVGWRCVVQKLASCHRLMWWVTS